jgi:shikimate dehydrogenase
MLFGVVGYPINHSLSPVMHNYWLKKYNIKANYVSFSVKLLILKRFLRLCLKWELEVLMQRFLIKLI